jgi:hypothetical protein
MNGPRVGTVTHYFDRIQVAVLQLDRPLAVGDWVRFVRRGYVLFDQEVTSMQIQHQFIQSARAGQEIALKVVDEVGEGAEVFRL